MSRQPWLRQGRWWALALLVVLAACGPKAADDLSSTDDLAAMLRQAGAMVQEADEPAPEAFDAQAVHALRVNEGVGVCV